MTNPPSRRKFFKTGCLSATGILLCGGGTLAATYQPPIDYPETRYGEPTMNDRIFVTYASKAGSTAEVAVRGLPVELLPVGKVQDLSPYRAVILGSAIRIGSPPPEAVKFIQWDQVTTWAEGLAV